MNVSMEKIIDDIEKETKANFVDNPQKRTISDLHDSLKYRMGKAKTIPILYELAINENYEELQKKEISKEFVLTYHYENYLVNLISIGDIIALLTKYTYKIEGDDDYCTLKKVLNRDNKKFYRTLCDKKIYAELDKLDKYLDEPREERNSIIHKGKSNSDEIKQLKQYSNATQRKFDNVCKSRYSVPLLRNPNLPLKTMNELNASLIKYISPILESIGLEFNQRF
jgi:hypothetical protein